MRIHRYTWNINTNTHRQTRNTQIQIHTRNTKYKYKYFVHICICICNCISYHSFLLFLLPAAGAGDQIFQKIAKMLHCIKSLVLDVYNFFLAHHPVQLTVEAGRRKHVTIILINAEKKSLFVRKGSRRNSFETEVTKTPPLIWYKYKFKYKYNYNYKYKYKYKYNYKYKYK